MANAEVTEVSFGAAGAEFGAPTKSPAHWIAQNVHPTDLRRL